MIIGCHCETFGKYRSVSKRENTELNYGFHQLVNHVNDWYNIKLKLFLVSTVVPVPW